MGSVSELLQRLIANFLEAPIWVAAPPLIAALLVAAVIIQRFGQRRLESGSRLGFGLWLFSGFLTSCICIVIIVNVVLVYFSILYSPKRCEAPVTKEAALEIARNYYLARPIALLEKGTAFDRKMADKLKEAGFDNDAYRQLVIEAKDAYPLRRLDGRVCGRPMLEYQQRQSDAIYTNGYTIVFMLHKKSEEMGQWIVRSFGLDVSPCGDRIHEFRARSRAWVVDAATEQSFNTCN